MVDMQGVLSEARLIICNGELLCPQILLPPLLHTNRDNDLVGNISILCQIKPSP